MTPAQVQQGLTLLQGALPDILKALSDKFLNVQEDEVVVEDIISALVDLGVLPFYANWIAVGLVWGIDNNQSATPNGGMLVADGHPHGTESGRM